MRLVHIIVPGKNLVLSEFKRSDYERSAQSADTVK
jgi:hypothetical protein